MIKREDLRVGQDYIDKLQQGSKLELTAIGLFNVLLMDHYNDTEVSKEIHIFLKEYEEVKKTKKITLYRYTFKTAMCNIAQTSWTTRSFNDFKYISHVLLKTEAKEVEVDDE